MSWLGVISVYRKPSEGIGSASKEFHVAFSLSPRSLRPRFFKASKLSAASPTFKFVSTALHLTCSPSTTQRNSHHRLLLDQARVHLLSTPRTVIRFYWSFALYLVAIHLISFVLSPSIGLSRHDSCHYQTQTLVKPSAHAG